MTRTEIIEFLNNQETYNKVLDIINNECQKNDTHINFQPIEDFLCGGAVANTLQSLIRGGEPVINDIDLFRFEHNKHLSYGFSNGEVDHDFSIYKPLNKNLFVDSYGRSWVGSSGESFSMVNTSRDGIINTTEISVRLWSQEFSLTESYITLLDNFDLNCTMVGIDRVNSKIVYTDGFVNFLTTNKIEVTRVDHPLQTTYRLVKKSEELNTDNSDIEKEILFLQHHAIITPYSFIDQKNLHKYSEKWDILGNYFTDPKQLEFSDSLLSVKIKPFNVVYGGFFTFTSAIQLVNFWNLFVRDSDNPKAKIVLDYFKSVKGWDLDSTFTFSEVFEYKYNPLISCLGEYPNYFDCDFTFEDLTKIDEFFNFVYGHENLDNSLFMMTNVVDQIKYIDFIKGSFIDKYHDLDLTKINNILTTSMKIQSNRVKIISPNVDERIEVTKYISNNYLGLRSIYIPKLKFGSEQKIKRET